MWAQYAGNHTGVCLVLTGTDSTRASAQIARCSGCGRRMSASSQGRNAKPPVYVCQCADRPDRYSTVVVERLDAEAVAQFFAHLDAFHVRAVDDADLEAARADVEARTGEVERLAQVVPQSAAGIAAHQAALSDAERALADAEDRLHQLSASLTESGPDVRELEADWPSLTLEERREILRAGIDAVLIRRASSRTAKPPVRERILVVFRGEAPDLVDNGRSGAVASWTWDHDVASLAAAT
jgi:hypothetical protein